MIQKNKQAENVITADKFGEYFLGEGNLSISLNSFLTRAHSHTARIGQLIGEEVTDLQGKRVGFIKDIILEDGAVSKVVLNGKEHETTYYHGQVKDEGDVPCMC